MFQAQKPLDLNSGDPAVRASPHPVLHQPNLPDNLPHLPDASPRMPSPAPPSPGLLPEVRPLPALPLAGNPASKKGLRRRHRSSKLPERGLPKLPVAGAAIPTKLPKRVRFALFVTRMKLRLKGLKAPSASRALKVETKLEAPVPTPVPVAVPSSTRL